MENKKLFGLGLTAVVLLVSAFLVLANHFVLANEEAGDDTEVEDVNKVDLKDVSPDEGRFGLIGTVTAVDAENHTIAVNGVAVDVSEAKIVGWRWKKLAEGTGRPWKEWWRDWTEEELKVGDKVRVGGRIEDGNLIARLVVLRAFRILERIRQCEVDTDCPVISLPSLQDKFEMKCVESRCKMVKKETGSTTEEGEEEIGVSSGGRARSLENIQQKIQEILQRIKELQSRMGSTSVSAQ